MGRKSRHKLIKEIIQEENPNALFLEPEFDKALIGTCKRYGRKTVAAYNSDICLQVLMSVHKLDEIGAYERFSDSLDTTKKEEHHPVFISDFRKIKMVDLSKIKESDTIDKLRTDGPS